MKLPPPLEQDVQAVIVAWAELALPKDAVLHHSSNEGRRGWKAQRWLKRSGAKKGWPDLELLFRGRTLFLEVKRKGEARESDQIVMHDRLEMAGFIVVTVDTFEDAQREIVEFIMAVRHSALPVVREGRAAG